MDRNSMLRYYGMLRDQAAQHSGYSRLEMHVIIKRKLFPLLIDEDDNFNLDSFSLEEVSNVERLSLKMLSDKGLEMFVEAARSFCFDNFNFYV